MPYFSPKESQSVGLKTRNATRSPATLESLSSCDEDEGADLLLSLSSSQKKSPKRLEISERDRSDVKRSFFRSCPAYDSESSSGTRSDCAPNGVREGKRCVDDSGTREKQKKRSRNQFSSTSSAAFEKGSNPAQSPHSSTGKRVISPATTDVKADVQQSQTPTPNCNLPPGYHHGLPPGSYSLHPGYALSYAVYPAHQYPPGTAPPHAMGFAYPNPYYGMAHPPLHHPSHAAMPQHYQKQQQQQRSSPHPLPSSALQGSSPSPVRDSPVTSRSTASPAPRPTSRASSTSSSSSESDSSGSASDAHSVKLPLSRNGAGMGEGRCLVIEGAMENYLCRGISTNSDTIEVPEFHRLANFPQFLNKGRTLEKCPVAPTGKKYCVMCGKLRLCSSTGRGKATREDVSHIIPRQNKGVCTACDIAVWSVVEVPGLQIKWCKGCKNFRQWKSFGQKGNATKCIRCRERQKIKYASQKYGRALDYPASTTSSSASPRKSPKQKDDTADDYLIAAANLRKLKESP